MPVPHSDLQSLSPSSIIELFELQLVPTLHGSSTLYRFHAGTALTTIPGDTGPIQNNAAVIWAGNTYTRVPIEADGFEYSGNGQLPQPKVRVSNILGTMSQYLAMVNAVTPGNDLIGAKFTRIRTLARYLDAANFPSRRNLFTSTDELGAAVWTPINATIVNNNGTGPLGEARADLLREDGTANQVHALQTGVTGLASGTRYVFSIYAKAAGRNLIRLELSGGTAFSTTQSAVFNLQTGVSTVTAGTPTATAEVSSTGWVRCSISAQTTPANGTVSPRIYLQATTGTFFYNGNSTSGVLLSDAQFEQSPLSAYQNVGTTFNQNPFGTPDSTVEFPREIYYVAQKTVENREVVEFTLASAFDLQGVRAPKRQCISSICQWIYRSPECGWVPGSVFFDENDKQLTGANAANLDVCGKRLSSCEARFGFIGNLSTTGTSSTLSLNNSLSAGERRVSTNGWYQIIFQADGNLVVYDKTNTPRWSSGTGGLGGTSATLLSTGNLVIRNAALNVLWQTSTGGQGITQGIMTTEGFFELRNGTTGAVVWSTSGGGGSKEPTKPDVGLPFGSFPGIGTYLA